MHRVIVPLGGTWMISARSALPLVVRGRAPVAHMTLLWVHASSPPARMGLQPIDPGCCAILARGAPVDLFFPEGCWVYAVAISDRPDRSSQPGLLDAFPAEGQSRVVRPAADRMAWLVRWANWIATRATRDPRIRASQAFKGRIRRALSNASHRILEDAQPVLDGDDSVPLRQRAVMRARDLVRARLSQPISLVDLCGIAKVQARTLEYGFRELYGMAPIAYVRCERLCRVHDELLEADRTTTSISATAMRWGFVHMSQFAKDYRTLFGESPSTTLMAQKRTVDAALWLQMERRRPRSAL